MRIALVQLTWLLSFSLNGQWAFEGDSTVTWEQAIARYRELDRQHSGAQLFEIGEDDDGSPLHLFVISDGSGFTPDSMRAAGKGVLWITNGIHPGEPDGIDASLMLAQALLESDQYMGLLAKTAVCIVPVHNVSGAKQRSATSRANQNGPAEYGFRGNARNLDLNRDFMKMDSRNTWSLVEALSIMDPDVYFETHVSNGADHQYVMELLTTQKDKLNGGLSYFMTRTMIPELHAWMERRGMLMCPYFEARGDIPEDGLYGFSDGARYSSGYNALFDRIGILSESHMLKPYADRVNATFQLMLATLAVMDEHGDELLTRRSEAKRFTASMTELGMNWRLDTTAWATLPWKGWNAERVASDVTGLPRTRYDRTKPTETMVPWNDSYAAALVKRKPKAYIVPASWHEAVVRLQANGVRMRALARDTVLVIDQDSIGDMSTSRSPYEGHYLHSESRTSTKSMGMKVATGSWFIPMGYATDRYVMEALEPEGEDSFFAWGFFDSVLQQKEWFSDYVFEDLAADWLKKNPEVRKALDAKRAADPAFAMDAFAQLYFVYKRSPWLEPGFRKYPVLRVPN
ncbi:MAG: hypothetical protein IPK70_14360 [Flavobacteriales bacterium]|nr:hypothetical protein [Flavobacteriales bacterium]